MQEVHRGEPIPVAQDDWDRGEYKAAIHNLVAPIKDLALPASQLAGTVWGDEIDRICGRLALIVLEVQADVAEADRQADEAERRSGRELARLARREATVAADQ